MLAASAVVLLLLIGGIGYELFHPKPEPKPDHSSGTANVATPVPTPIDKPTSTDKPTPIVETASTDKTVPTDKKTSTDKTNPIDKPNSTNKPIFTDKPAPIERVPVAHSPITPETNPAPPVDKTKNPEPERKATPPIAPVPFTLAGQVPVGSVVVQVGAVPQQESAELLLMALRQKGYTLVARHQPIQDHLFHIQTNPLGDEKEAAALRQRLVHDGFTPVIYRAKECSGHLLCWTNLTPSN